MKGSQLPEFSSVPGPPKLNYYSEKAQNRKAPRFPETPSGMIFSEMLCEKSAHFVYAHYSGLIHGAQYAEYVRQIFALEHGKFIKL